MVQSPYQLSGPLTESEQEELGAARRENLGSMLARATELFRSALIAEFEALDQSQLRPSHMRVLMSLDLDGNRSSELADRMGLRRQTVSALLLEMAKWGIVEFQPDPSDGRAKLVLPTDSGVALIVAITRIAGDVTRNFTEIIGQRRMTQLHSTLKMLIESFEEDAIDGGASSSL